MLILSLLPLLLVTACCAAPSRRENSCLPADLLDIPSHQTQLVAPKTPPKFVTLGVGNQNYTCTSAGTYRSVGAIVQLFDITSLYPGPSFKDIQSDAYITWAYNIIKNPLDPALAKLFANRYNVPVSGQHYFIKSDGQLAPVWDFRSDGSTKGNQKAVVVAKVTGDITSPTHPTALDWQELSRVSGELADTIFRTDTIGGDPSPECTPGTEDITVKFTAKYWLYGGEVGTCKN